MKKHFLLSVFIFLAIQVYAQPKIKFEKTTHDFGEVKEEGGAISHAFIFTNIGDEPLELKDVQASCGCTTPFWSKEPISPGETGMVKATYNPRNRPGEFSKSVSVATNEGMHTLYIKGMVLPRPKSPETDFPAQIGSLRTRYRSFNMGKLTTKEPVTKSFAAYNQGNQVLRFEEEVAAPEHITVRFEPAELLPQQKGKINITYDPVAKNDLGFVTDRIRVYTNEADDSIKEFSIMATIEEYFAPMTQEALNQAPRIAFDHTLYEFSTVDQGELVSTVFTFTNTGKSPLNIRKVKANCGCTVAKPQKTTLEPGESSSLMVTFDTEGRRGRQYKSVAVFTNDPTKPTHQLTIKGIVRGEDDSE